MAASSSCGLCSFPLQVIKGRWFMMFASFLIMAGAGATYLFGVYSKEIKQTLGYDQSTLNLLGSFKDLGANVGVLSGLLAEVTPPWFVLLVGAAMNFAGYFLIWLAVMKKIPKPSITLMCLYICIGANSQNFANTGSLVTCVKNFPESRGMMLGLMKGFVGLSGAVFTQLYLAIYGNDAKALILLIGWLPALISIMFLFNIREMKVSRHPNEVRVFHQCLCLSIALALALMGVTIAQKYVRFSHNAYVVSASVVCFLLFLPCLIAVREELATWKAQKRERKLSQSNALSSRVVDLEDPPLPVSKSVSEIEPVSESVSEIEPSSKSVSEIQSASKAVSEIEPASKSVHEIEPVDAPIKEKESTNVPCFANICNKPKRGDDYTILQALLSIDMLLLFVATFCGLGCSLAAVDNLGQIGESLGYPTRTIGTFVSLVSVWNYFGRVFSGFVSEYILIKWKIPRTLMMTFVLILPAIGDLFIALAFPGSVYIASLLIGFSYGAQLTLLFIIISELFGLKYYSTLFNCGQLSSPIGSYILNVRIVGKLYDNEALKQLASKGMTRSMVQELTCIGKQCYRNSFLILACTNFFGALVSLILVWRTKEYYKTDIYKKFREAMEANEKEMALVSADEKK